MSVATPEGRGTEAVAAPAEAPFFLVYDARSGSTFLASRLVATGAVSIPPETNFVPEILQRFPQPRMESREDVERLVRIAFRDPKFEDLGFRPDRLAEALAARLPLTPAGAIRSILARYRDREHPGARRSGIKKGSYLLHWEAIRDAFPSAPFVGLVRDGRAVFASKKRSRLSATGKPFETDPRAAARRWVECSRRLRELERRHGPTLVLRYESLVAEPERTVRGVLAWLGLDPEADAPESARSYAIPARYGRELHGNVHRAPRPERLGAWERELDRGEIEAFEEVAGPELARRGYRPVARAGDGA